MSLDPSDTNKIYVVESRRDYIPVVQTLLSNIAKNYCLWASSVSVKLGNLSLLLW